MRLSIIVFAAISAISLVVMTSDANAQRGGGNRYCPAGGLCPEGTCSNSGTRRACNVQNCKASTCKRSSLGTERPLPVSYIR